MAGVRDHYAEHPEGAAGWYAGEAGGTYRNPHEDAVNAMVHLAHHRWPELFADEARFLDLCTGSGEVVRALIECAVEESRIDATDPFTGASFQREHGRRLLAEWTFADIATRELAGYTWDTIWCSYALHLCEPSWLPLVCQQLALATKHLLIITPHKRPELHERWGFTLVDEHRDGAWRVRLRRYDTNTPP